MRESRSARKFSQYCANLQVLSRAPEQDLGNEFVVSGIIDKFALQFELGWKTLREFLMTEGVTEAVSGSPRGIIKAANKLYEFVDGDRWIDMLNDRNRILHLYSAEASGEVCSRVLDQYIGEFEALARGLKQMYSLPQEQEEKNGS